jgi:hypothetical protein
MGVRAQLVELRTDTVNAVRGLVNRSDNGCPPAMPTA